MNRIVDGESRTGIHVRRVGRRSLMIGAFLLPLGGCVRSGFGEMTAIGHESCVPVSPDFPWNGDHGPNVRPATMRCTSSLTAANPGPTLAVPHKA
jgi:hypothetical protein